jgi:hypothetical protein
MDDSFDIDKYAPDPQPTAIRRPRKPTRKAYGRRGNEAQLSRHSSLQGTGTNFGDDDDNDDDGAGLFGAAFSGSRSDLLMGERIESSPRKWETDMTATATTMTTSTPVNSSARRRKYTRSHSITGTTSTTPNIPRAPPMLKRSLSVSYPNTIITSTCYRSSSVSSSLSSMDNFDPFNNENLHQQSSSISPKRAADDHEKVDATIDENHQGSGRRKKTKPEPRSFFNNDFSSLLNDGDTNDNKREGQSKDKSSFLGSSQSSFSNLARHGRAQTGWAALSQPETDVPEVASSSFASPATTTTSRKRSSQDSPSSDDDGTPPKSRSRSKVDATPDNIRKESPIDSRQMMSIDSIPRQNDDTGMDLSIFSPTINRESDRSSPVMDVSMTDDEVNMTADESGDDHTVSPDDPFPSQPSAGGAERPSNGPTPRLEPEKASVDDVINSMPSYDHLKFLVGRLGPASKIAYGTSLMTFALTSTDFGREQREGFIQWTMTTLGFQYRISGNRVVFISIPKERGFILLKLLNKAVRECRDRGVGGATPAIEKQSARTSAFIYSPATTSRPQKSFRPDSVARPLHLDSPKEYVCIKRMKNRIRQRHGRFGQHGIVYLKSYTSILTSTHISLNNTLLFFLHSNLQIDDQFSLG